MYNQNKIEWTTEDYIVVGKQRIACVPDLKDGYNQGCGVRFDSKTKIFWKSILYPILNIHNYFLVDGFIEYYIGKLIKKYISDDTSFLEIGCGDMGLRRFLPKSVLYNALDLELSEFQIRKNCLKKNKINIVLASAADIPVSSDVASLIVSTETFEHIPEINKAIDEIYRVAKPNAIVICSIPNNYCYKYNKKGPHAGHVNNWTYDGFVQFMKSHNFDLVQSFMKGWWVPFPLWLTKISYQLPFSSTSEYYNTNFFYVFRTKK